MKMFLLGLGLLFLLLTACQNDPGTGTGGPGPLENFFISRGTGNVTIFDPRSGQSVLTVPVKGFVTQAVSLSSTQGETYLYLFDNRTDEQGSNLIGCYLWPTGQWIYDLPVAPGVQNFQVLDHKLFVTHATPQGTTSLSGQVTIITPGNINPQVVSLPGLDWKTLVLNRTLYFLRRFPDQKISRLVTLQGQVLPFNLPYFVQTPYLVNNNLLVPEMQGFYEGQTPTTKLHLYSWPEGIYRGSAGSTDVVLDRFFLLDQRGKTWLLGTYHDYLEEAGGIMVFEINSTPQGVPTLSETNRSPKGAPPYQFLTTTQSLVLLDDGSTQTYTTFSLDSFPNLGSGVVKKIP